MYVPNQAKLALKKLGQSIKNARKRRQLTVAELSEKLSVSPPTVISLEKGEPTVRLGVLVSALWVMGLEQELMLLINPKDTEGLKLMDHKLPKRIRKSKGKLDNDF